MAQILDMSGFAFNGDTLRSVAELVFDEVIRGPEVSMLHTVYPNIVTQREIGFIGKGGLVGVKNQGCGPTAQDWNVGTRKVTFDPAPWEILIAACWTDLQASAAVYSLNTGTAIADFTSTDYMAILQEVLGNAMNEFLYRFIWFNSTDAANVTDGGEITDGVDVKYFNLIDGLFDQMQAQVVSAGGAKQHVTIAENSSRAVLTPAQALAYLGQVYDAAPIQLRSQRNKFILVTQSVYDAYVKSLQGLSLESTYVNLVNGMQTAAYNGVPVIAMPIWDEILASYMSDATGPINPHRIVFTTPDVLAFGVDNPSAFDTIESWYDRDSRNVKIEAMGQADAKLANPSLFVYGV